VFASFRKIATYGKRVVTVFLLPLLQSKEVLFVEIFSFHDEVWWAEPNALEDQIEIRPFEHQLGDVVHLGIFEQTERTHGRKWIFADKWFGVVIEIDDVGFPEA
jgi:hypothetical protein